ncbi:taurine ABC transporter permease, partial [Burkholderia gladioli]|nr:taurine ABC transporter permease [Burkholderia gladioli]
MSTTDDVRARTVTWQTGTIVSAGSEAAARGSRATLAAAGARAPAGAGAGAGAGDGADAGAPRAVSR